MLHLLVDSAHYLKIKTNTLFFGKSFEMNDKNIIFVN